MMDQHIGAVHLLCLAIDQFIPQLSAFHRGRTVVVDRWVRLEPLDEVLFFFFGEGNLLLIWTWKTPRSAGLVCILAWATITVGT